MIKNNLDFGMSRWDEKYREESNNVLKKEEKKEEKKQEKSDKDGLYYSNKDFYFLDK